MSGLVWGFEERRKKNLVLGACRATGSESPSQGSLGLAQL